MSKYRQRLQTGTLNLSCSWWEEPIKTSLDLLGICRGRYLYPFITVSLCRFHFLSFFHLSLLLYNLSPLFSPTLYLFSPSIWFFLSFLPYSPIHFSLSLSVFLPYCTSKSMETTARADTLSIGTNYLRPATECPSIYHEAINVSSACRKSMVCKTLNIGKFKHSHTLVSTHMLTNRHKPPLTKMKLTMYFTVCMYCGRNDLYTRVAFGDISLMHHFYEFECQSEKHNPTLSLSHHRLYSL